MMARVGDCPPGREVKVEMKRVQRALLAAVVAGGILASVTSCSSSTEVNPVPTTGGGNTAGTSIPGTSTTGASTPGTTTPGTSSPGASSPAPAGRVYPSHTGIIATTFWVGEIFDPNASDGSQVYSTYDSEWLAHYGGCDGVVSNGDCETEERTAANGYFPSSMTPLENPFYLDLPFDDINDPAAFARRGTVIPWADDPGYAGRQNDPSFSYMKNRWVAITKGDKTCYAQIQDAGPGQYNDAEYVFGTDDQRPKNKNFNSAGMDVSPAVNGCLGFSDVNGENDMVDWHFVDEVDVPPGPWLTVVTSSPVTP